MGRFVAYKRPTLFLSDPARLARLLSDPDRPVQIVYAGKAHPDDESGKRLLQTVTDFAVQHGLTHRLVFIEDFDLTADRVLAQGVDLWLNTPRRPLEACGIGGMKAGVNGALNFSTLDGWWDEVWNDAIPGAPPIGWCIGTDAIFEDHALQDLLDAESLYSQLEEEIVPMFFDEGDDGIPHRWLASVRQSMATLAETWRSHRMVQHYVDDLYLPCAVRAERLMDNDARRARRLAANLGRLERAWPEVSVEVREVEWGDDVVAIEIAVSHPGLVAADLTVDVWVWPVGAAPYPVAAHRSAASQPDADHGVYRARLAANGLAGADVAARAAPPRRRRPEQVPPEPHHVVDQRRERTPRDLMARSEQHPSPALSELAVDRGVLLSYLDHGGARRVAGHDALVAVLESLGESEAGSNPERALVDRRARAADRVLEPTQVVPECARSIVLTPPPRSRKLELELSTEHGDVIEWSVPVDELAALPGAPRGTRQRVLDVPIPLDAGYHSLRVRTSRREERGHVLAKPARAARGRFDGTWRATGVAAPLFTLHSERSWGCGDLTDLDQLARIVRGHGASVVATLPLLAGFGPEPFEPSPYLPVSRMYWHERWIDVEAEFDSSTPNRLLARARELKAELRAAATAAHPLVDGARSLAGKREILSELVRSLRSADSTRLEDYEAFVAARPALVDYARFRAAGDELGIDWTTWPHRLRDGSIVEGDVDRGLVELYCYGQWVAQRQLTEVARRCEQRGQVLSLDLPLGAHARGYDVWRHRDQFVERLAVGAPPDRFFPGGQWWGFPPPSSKPRGRRATRSSAPRFRTTSASRACCASTTSSGSSVCSAFRRSNTGRGRLRHGADRRAARRGRDRGAAPSRLYRRRGPRHGRRRGAARHGA